MKTIRHKNTALICSSQMLWRTALILVFIFVLQLDACPLWGQVLQKKKLTSADYSLWNHVYLDNVSQNEQWASYRLVYADNSDSLFVKSINSNQSYAFKGIESSIFINDHYFVASQAQDLNILNLDASQKERIENVVQYKYSDSTELLILIVQPKGRNTSMVIRSPAGKIVKEIPEVSGFSLSPDACHVVYASLENNKYAMRILNLKDISKEKFIVLNAKDSLSGFTWQKNGYSVAFFSCDKQKSIKSVFHYILKEDQLFTLNTSLKTEFPDSLRISSSPELRVSDDIQRVFFNVVLKDVPEKSKSESNVEIWNGNDKWLYPEETRNGRFEKADKSAVWIPQSHFFSQLSTNELPKIALTGHQDFAILSNPKDYEPQAELNSPRDYYLLNLKTFKKTLFLEKLKDERYNVNPSPGGRYIAYFKEGDWWVYSLKENKHTNITAKIQTKFTAREEFFNPESVCGNPGWSFDDNEILLYDKYDIWAVSPDGLSYRRLTNGKESKIKFRIAETPNKFYYSSIYQDNHLKSYDLNRELLLKAEGEDLKTGFFVWTKHTKTKEIVYKDAYIDQLFYGPKKKKFFFKEQKFDLSPRLAAVDRSLHYKTFYQSNPQQQHYYWGKSELIRYKNSKGISMRAALLYPANYDPEKKYPMIVDIYELNSKEIHHYKNPSLYNEDGFNRTNFSLEGYFVLLPDLIQEYQNVGPSIVDCVTSAVNKVLVRDIINPNKIGLIGFSAGGYETVFTITQTNLFTSAIAGGANTDLHSLYFSIGNGTGKSEMWRFQSTYWMLEQNPFERHDLFDASSPLFYAQKVETPLLLWTGKNDPQVDPHQSMAFYLAVRSLRKQIIMLRYPDQTHTLSKPVNQLDITTRMHQWFDYFLKDIPCDWIENGVK